MSESNQKEVALKVTENSMTMYAESTVEYIAEPSDLRCSWWSVILPDTGLELSKDRLNLPYLRAGADLELRYGQMLIDSEAMHHRKNRGYRVLLIVSFGNECKSLVPTAVRKKHIKANGGQDLMHESGDVAGCIRMAVWLRRQPDLSMAFDELKSITK
jgi:hypothetical protein